jgi:hypothetical protein
MTPLEQPAVFKLEFTVPGTEGSFSPPNHTLTAEQCAFASSLFARYEDHVVALGGGDVQRVLAFFTEDAVWMGLGWPSREGKKDLRELFSDVAGTAQVRCTSLYAYVHESTGWNFVDYFVTPNDASINSWTFRTAFQWVCRDNQWLCNGVLCYRL